jgi:hypothetical protein
MRWRGPRWKAERNAAILAAVGQGASPVEIAQQYRVPLRAVLGIWDGAKLREQFARERAEGGGRRRGVGVPSRGNSG